MQEEGRRWDERLLARGAVGLVLLPFVVAAVVQVAGGGDYLPISDHALTELRVRDIGSYPVLSGLFSRDDWSHPGPLFFYLLVPFYRLSGNASISINVVTLLLNGGAIVGMAVVARRRGGLPLLLCTLLACSLLVRTLGADFLSDPWNPYVTVLPFGLVVLLAWSVACRDVWALPAAAVTASFLAQTHVGFVALALPLVGLGAAWLVVAVLRAPDGQPTRRDVAKVLAITAAVTLVLWSPVVVDVLTSSDHNLGRIIAWFDRAEGGTHTVVEGWRVISGQLAVPPEWLTSHREPFWLTGEPTLLYRGQAPLLLALVAGAAVVFRRARRADGGRLVAFFVATFALAVFAIVRTVGPAFDYRLRWTWVVGALGFVAILWAGWTLVNGAPRAVRRAIAGVALATLVTSTAVNAVVAARGETPRQGDTEALADVLPAVVDAVRGTGGQVLVDNGGWDYASWYTRSIVLQLERRGIDARMLPTEEVLVGQHRVVDPDAVSHHLIVAIDSEIARRDEEPGLRRLALWSSVTDAQVAAFERRTRSLDRQVDRGERTAFERTMVLHDEGLNTFHEAVAWRLAVYLVEPGAQRQIVEPSLMSPDRS